MLNMNKSAHKHQSDALNMYAEIYMNPPAQAYTYQVSDLSELGLKLLLKFFNMECSVFCF